MRFVLTSDEVEPQSPVGGKAKALAALTHAGLPIPDWAVVVPDAFYASLGAEGQRELEGAQSPDHIRTLIQQIQPSTEVRSELAAALAALCPAGELVAVRSSAPDEDLATHSFAGQLESFLFVGPGELADRIARVWRSGFGERLIVYRREAGLPPIPRAPAVVVQRMIDAEVAGIAFSLDPVSGRHGVAVVTALPGLASALVSGEACGDTWRVDRGGVIVERAVSDKRLVHRADPTSVGGVRVEVPPADVASRPCLDDDGVREVAALARGTERFFGRPQDIEWATARGRLYLLQSRPVTALARKADPDGLRAVWDNSNIIESYSGVTTPLTFSFVRRAYEEVYRDFSRLVRVPEAVIENNAETFRCLLGLIRGRVYYNLRNWYRMIALLPGYRLNRKFLEEMLGLGQSLPEDMAASVHAAETGRAREALRVAAAASGLLAAYVTLRRRIAHFYGRLEETLGTRRPDLSAWSAEDLAAHYVALEARVLHRWDAPIVNDFWAMVFHGLLRRLLRKWAGGEPATLLSDLLGGEPGMISAEPARRVRAMALKASPHAALVDALQRGSLVAIHRALRQVPDLEREYHEYLERFGDRCTGELKLESPTLYDDPLPLLRSVGQYAVKVVAGEPRADEDEERRRRDAEHRAFAAIGWRPLRRLVFSWVLRNARARLRDRENLRFQRTRGFGRGRLILLEIGKRLAAVDVLDEPRDVFYLEVDELLCYIEGRATTTDLRGLSTLRRAEFERFRSAPAPADRFETRGMAYVGNAFESAAPVVRPSGEALTGLGCCPGVVRGPVRIVRDPRQTSLAPGEIVVAEWTDPGWVTIFPAAAGLLVERGSLLSHSAIVARELGLPTIVSLAGVTGWLRDGDWIEMDGATGRVVRLGVGSAEGSRAAA